jgi:transposase
LAPDVHAALIWDGAGFHRAHDLKVPANVTLIPLPPYSPELNGIENLWHYLRSHCWSNRAYANYDELFDVASESWCRYCLDTELIKSVCAKNYFPTRT